MWGVNAGLEGALKVVEGRESVGVGLAREGVEGMGAEAEGGLLVEVVEPAKGLAKEGRQGVGDGDGVLVVSDEVAVAKEVGAADVERPYCGVEPVMPRRSTKLSKLGDGFLYSGRFRRFLEL